jgi:hypothetical protein
MLNARDMGSMDVFGPWLPWLFGVGTILLVGGLLAKEMAPNSSAQKMGRGAANVGWRLILLAVVVYLLILGLGAVFDSFTAESAGNETLSGRWRGGSLAPSRGCTLVRPTQGMSFRALVLGDGACARHWK